MNRLNYYIIDSECDAVILSNCTDMHYNAGYAPDWGYYVYLGAGNYLFTDGRFTLEAKSCLSDDYTIIEVNSGNAFDVIGELLSKNNVHSLGYSSDISYIEHCRFTAGFKSFRLFDISSAIASARIAKDNDELNCIIKAQRIAEKALNALLFSKVIVEGVAEREIAAKLEYFMRVHGSDGASFPTIVAFGSNSAFAHARPGDRRLNAGDIILFDFGAKYNGYCSDMSRTFVYKSASDEIIQMYNAVLAANIAAIKAVKVGADCKVVDSIARDVLAQSGYGQYFNHSLGHGVGVEIHEEPCVSQSSDSILRENSVITIEPGVYIEDIGGIRIEDMIVVRGDACHNITEFDKELYIID